MSFGVVVEQSSNDLRLLLLRADVNHFRFNVYASDVFVFGNPEVRVSVNIIGESHVVVCEGLGKGAFSEVLACVPLGESEAISKELFHVGLFAHLKTEKRFDGFTYAFELRKIAFDDPQYHENYKAILQKGDCKVGYNFDIGKSEAVSENNPHEAVTLVAAQETPRGLSWSSVHVYPNEKHGVFSKTALTRELGSQK